MGSHCADLWTVGPEVIQINLRISARGNLISCRPRGCCNQYNSNVQNLIELLDKGIYV